MNIHLHNYEEYFILYLDNELSGDDRRQVEAFILQHPELKEELDILSQYKLVPDTDIVFPGKSSLMKGADNDQELNPELPGYSYMEGLLLYADNELNDEERKSIEQFIASHPAAALDLSLLQRARLQPENISFPDKQSLYRHEEKVRVITIRWWKVAAAAAIILALGLSTFLMVNKNHRNNNEGIATGPAQQKEKQKEKEDEKQNGKEKVEDSKIGHSTELAVDNSTKPSTIIRKKAIEKKKIETPVKEKKSEAPQLVSNDPKPSNNLPQPDESTARINVPDETLRAKSPTHKVTPEIENNTPVTSVAVNSSYTQSPAVEDGVAQSSGKKSKLRGFFRKLTRTFEKATKIDASDKDQVLIGGLAFKLK